MAVSFDGHEKAALGRRGLTYKTFDDALTIGRARMKIQIIIASIVLVGVTALAPVASARECNIKGNVSTKGERIYHVPGQKYYDKTVIQSSHGERWFCTEAEARAAGWRRSKV